MSGLLALSGTMILLFPFLRSVDSRLEATEGVSEAVSPPPPDAEPPPSPGVTRMVERLCGLGLCSDWLVLLLWVWTVTTGVFPTAEAVVTMWLHLFLSIEPSRIESELSESTFWSLCSKDCLWPAAAVPGVAPAPVPWSRERHLHDPLPSVDGGWITGLLFSGWASTLTMAPVLPEMLREVLPSEPEPVLLVRSWSMGALQWGAPWLLPFLFTPMLLSSKLLECVCSSPCCLDMAITCMIRGWLFGMFPLVLHTAAISAALCQLAWAVLFTADILSLPPSPIDFWEVLL